MPNLLDPNISQQQQFMQALELQGMGVPENANFPVKPYSSLTQIFDLLGSINNSPIKETPVNVSPGQVVPSTPQGYAEMPLDGATPSQNVTDTSQYDEVLKGTPFEGMYDDMSDLAKNMLTLKGFDFDTFKRQLAEYLQAGNYTAIQGLLSRLRAYNINVSPELEKWLDNMIAKENTGEARDWEEQMRDTSYLSAASQLNQLGLTSSGVLQTGGASHSGVGAAKNNMDNMGKFSEQLRMQKYQQRMALAKQLISMTSSMAAAGIGGGSLVMAKNAAGTLASQAAHSGLNALHLHYYNR